MLEASFWKLLQKGLRESGRKIETTRLESWATPGVPDVLCCNEAGEFSFLELKVKRKKITLSAHQISWLLRHGHANCYVVVIDDLNWIHVYAASDAGSLNADRHAAVPALGIFTPPYVWPDFWRLTGGDR